MDKKWVIDSVEGLIIEGIFSKTTKDELLALEERKDKLEISIEKEKNKLQKPLDESDVRKFLQYYAHKEYKNNEEKTNSFLHLLIV